MDSPIQIVLPKSLGRLLSLCVSVASVVSQGCLTVQSPHPDVIQEIGSSGHVASSRAVGSLAMLYPEQARMTHRAILTVRGRQFAFDGYVAKAGDNLRLVATGAVGLIGELKWSRNGGAEIIRNGPFFRPAWSKDYMARDLALLLAPPVKTLTTGWLSDGRIVLWQAIDRGNGQLRYIFSPDGETLQRIEYWRALCLAYSVECLRYRKFPECPRPIPSEFVVHGESYELHLSVVDLVTTTEPVKTQNPGAVGNGK